MSYFASLIFILCAYMSLWFVISVIKKRNDVADVAWGLGFVLMAWTSFLLSEDIGTRGFLVSLLVSLWGVRLAWHIHSRNAGKSEDYRYLSWRKEWGAWFYVRSFFQVYILQGTLLLLIVFPVLLINKNVGADFGLLDFLGITIWLFGFCFEVIGDAQLARFLKNTDNKGKLMQSGLWVYTRHSNYFGEVTQWWGIWLLALSVPSGIFGIVGPITITLLILKISGIPLLEQKMAENPEFETYKKRVSIFIPLPPKNC